MHDSYTIHYKPGTSSSTLSFAYALLWAPTGPKSGNLKDNYSLPHWYKAVISTASLVLRRLFCDPNSMFSFQMATMVGLPFLVNALLSLCMRD